MRAQELGPLETDYGEELGCSDAYRSGQLVPPHPLNKKNPQNQKTKKAQIFSHLPKTRKMSSSGHVYFSQLTMLATYSD